MSSNKDSLGDRMKLYESVPKIFLTRRIPAIIRLDGKAFHTFTKGLNKPFDDVLIEVMQNTMKYLCENIQGCVFGYTQSDEITLVLTAYTTPTTDAWFGYNVQKMTSISASIATLAFNRFWNEQIERLRQIAWSTSESYNIEDRKVCLNAYKKIGAIREKAMKATFDSRVFSLPKEEVVNCLIWRQQDATRNSIEAVGQANFSANQLHGKTCNMVQDMLMIEKGINWNDFSVVCKRGTSCYKRQIEKEIIDPIAKEYIKVIRNEWFIDKNMPILTTDKNYVEKWL